MRTLRRMCGVTKHDRIKNECIKMCYKVTNIAGKIKEHGLRWFGYIYKINNDYIIKQISEIKVERN